MILAHHVAALTECFLSTAPIPLRDLRDLRAMLSLYRVILAHHVAALTGAFVTAPHPISVASVTSVRCFPYCVILAHHAAVLTEGFSFTAPNPLRDLGDLRAMLSPIA